MEDRVTPAESTMHFYFNWAKERIDEMDAAVGSLEGKATQVKADSKVKAEQLIADFKRRRDEFEAPAKYRSRGEVAGRGRAPTGSPVERI